MNQTSTTDPGPEPATVPGPQPGVNREHLRRFDQLRRSIADRRIAGVAGGLGRHLNIDPTVLRVLFVVLVFFGGSGLLLYVAAWLLVPEDGRSHAVVSVEDSTRNALLIVVGVVAALLLLGDSWGGYGFPWPLFLAGIGVLVYVLLKDRRQDRTEAAGPGAGWVGPAPTTSVPGTGPGWVAPQPDQQGHQPGSTAFAPASSGTGSTSKRGPKLFGATLALLLLAVGVLGLYDATGSDVAVAAYPALALAVVGVLLVVGSFVGRAGGLILLGLLSSFALLAGSTLDALGGSDIGSDRLSVQPTSAAQVRSDYTIRSGRAVVDLSTLGDPGELAGRTITVDGRAGELVVILPDGVRSDVRASIDGPGAIDLPDRNAGGIGSTLSAEYGEGSGLVTIDAGLDVGHIDIQEVR